MRRRGLLRWLGRCARPAASFASTGVTATWSPSSRRSWGGRGDSDSCRRIRRQRSRRPATVVRPPGGHGARRAWARAARGGRVRFSQSGADAREDSLARQSWLLPAVQAPTGFLWRWPQAPRMCGSRRASLRCCSRESITHCFDEPDESSRQRHSKGVPYRIPRDPIGRDTFSTIGDTRYRVISGMS